MTLLIFINESVHHLSLIFIRNHLFVGKSILNYQFYRSSIQDARFVKIHEVPAAKQSVRFVPHADLWGPNHTRDEPRHRVSDARTALRTGTLLTRARILASTSTVQPGTHSRWNTNAPYRTRSALRRKICL